MTHKSGNFKWNTNRKCIQGLTCRVPNQQVPKQGEKSVVPEFLRAASRLLQSLLRYINSLCWKRTDTKTY